jgi:acetyl esterase/lipase
LRARVTCALLLCGAPAALFAGVEVTNGVTYATHAGEDLKLDLAVPEGAGPFPLIVFIHGGGWQAGNRSDATGAVMDAAQRGYAAATVSYRFTPRYPWPAQLEDVEAAVRWLRANATKHRIDPTRVAAAGWSAGGQLSLMLGTTPREAGANDAGVDAVVNFFGPTDMTTDVFNDAVDKIFVDLAGGTRDAKATAYREFSPVTRVTRSAAPVLTFHGSADTIVPPDQAKVLQRALDAAHVPNRLEILEGRGHGWGGDDQKRTTELSFEFLDPYLKGSTLPVLFSEDFTSGAERWEPTEPDAWTVAAKDGRGVYTLGKPAKEYARRSITR